MFCTHGPVFFYVNDLLRWQATGGKQVIIVNGTILMMKLLYRKDLIKDSGENMEENNVLGSRELLSVVVEIIRQFDLCQYFICLFKLFRKQGFF